MIPGKSDVIAASCRLQNSKAFGDDLAPYSVPFNHCNLVLVHDTSLSSISDAFAPSRATLMACGDGI